MRTMTRRGALLTLAGSLTAGWLVGCGGGGDSMGETRKKVVNIDAALAQGSAVDPMRLLTGNLGLAGSGSADRINTFLGGVGALPAGRGDAVAQPATRSRAADADFHYDPYLELWAQRSETPTETRYDFYADQEKLQPAGKIVSTHPEWWGKIYPYDILAPYPGPPYTFRTDYEFTAGTLKNAHGFSESATLVNWEYTSRYENVYSDGWKDRGESRSASDGSTWFSRIETPEGQYAEAAGSFRNAAGGARMKSSDGYTADYQFSQNGGGHGKIEGPDPGLPVTSSWDGSGNVLIRWADGTTETVRRGGNPGPVPLPMPVGGGGSTVADSSGAR